MSTLQPPDHPLALRHSHLLAPAPDRLTNTPTTLTITRSNTVSGRAFSVHQLRAHEPFDSPARRSLLYTVSGKFWSGTLAREIRDAAGRPLLELRRRIWWRAWSVKQPGGGEELMSAEMRWGASVKMAVRVQNALLAAGLLDNWRDAEEREREYVNSHDYYPIPSGRRRHGHGHNSNSNSNSSGGRYARRHISPPPPYSAIASSSVNNPLPRPSTDTTSTKSTHLPSYASAHRRSTHSLRDLLDAVEPPAEPAPASSYAFPPARRHSEAVGGEKVALRVVRESNTAAAVMMGERKIVSIRREKVLEFGLSGPVDRWEVGVAEGVDLLLAVSIVLILAEFVRHEYRVRIK
ncbi:uncharacterized protein N7482_010185 [Penicillium canariense]|uniref:Uncharacterized protein n=1 Tax=Penicillium canariense TaxID=189055 RepID=A0A9W9HJE6_9EURO|nr:uncharacterized protein N7482_010185 [Penicillium canariense]KAJ5150933.1 hypothetical protein N7482_010185 [Penicillium canariense]